MAKPKVFISRDLSDQSPFEDLQGSHELHGTSLIEFFPIPFEAPQSPHWFFFYSQQGVKHFFEQWKDRAPLGKTAAFGPATASRIRDYGITPRFVGDGVADRTATAFLTVAQNQVVVFVRAKKFTSLRSTAARRAGGRSRPDRLRQPGNGGGRSTHL